MKSTQNTVDDKSLAFVCPSRSGLFPDPKSCSHFYRCSHWIPQSERCASGLHFNPENTICDWPYRAGCSAETSTETTSPQTEASKTDSEISTPTIPSTSGENDRYTESQIPTTDPPTETSSASITLTEIITDATSTSDETRSTTYLINDTTPGTTNSSDETENGSTTRLPTTPTPVTDTMLPGTDTRDDGYERSTATVSTTHLSTTPESTAINTSSDNSTDSEDDVATAETVSPSEQEIETSSYSSITITNVPPTTTTSPTDIRWSTIISNTTSEGFSLDDLETVTDSVSPRTTNHTTSVYTTTVSSDSSEHWTNSVSLVSEMTTENSITFPETTTGISKETPFSTRTSVTITDSTTPTDTETSSENVSIAEESSTVSTISTVTPPPIETLPDKYNSALTDSTTDSGPFSSSASTTSNGSTSQTPSLETTLTDEADDNSSSLFTCPLQSGLFPDPKSCFRFYHCSHWTSHQKSCPSDLHFNPELRVCDWPYQAGCASDDKTVSSTSATVSKPSICTEEDGLYPEKDDCTKYYQCVAGRAYAVLCPPGLHFNVEYGICEDPCDAQCDPGPDCSTEITQGNCTCEGCFLPDLTDCSAYYHCRNGRLIKQYCPRGTLFDRASDQCVSEDSTICEATGDPAMCPEPYGIFPYPGQCKKFVHCEDSVARIEDCVVGLEFDPELRACTNPKGYCGAISINSNCDRPSGVFSHPSNCSLFYHCDRGTAYLKSCPSPLLFNSVNEVCDWPYNVVCEEGQAVRKRSISNDQPNVGSNILSLGRSRSYPAANATISNSTILSCPLVPGITCPCACRVPAYDDCNSFYQCQEDGTACRRSCPDGLYFDKREMVCDLPDNVQCRDFFSQPYLGSNLGSISTTVL